MGNVSPGERGSYIAHCARFNNPISTQISYPKYTLKKDTDIIKKDTDIIKKDTDIIKKDTDIIKKDTDIIKKDTDIIKKDTETSIEMVYFVEDRKHLQKIELEDEERQIRLHNLLTIIKKHRDILINIKYKSWAIKEEISRINYIMSCINTKHITDEYLRDIMIYISGVTDYSKNF